MTDSVDIQEKISKSEYKTDDGNKIIKSQRKNTFFTCVNQKTTKIYEIYAWILLTVGLCIVVTTSCLTTIQYSNNVLKNNENTEAIQNELDFEDLGRNRNKIERVNGTRGTSDTSDKIESDNVNRCKEVLCEITCENVQNIYTALGDTIRNSLCPFINTLRLEKQYFHLGVLKNDWLPSNISFNQVVIRLSTITRIESNAFNSPLFKNTFGISLYDMNISNVESGALLGLYRLKYLTIKSRIRNFESALLQPVQTSLVKLKLNALLRIEGNRNLFGANYLNKLSYLDLSRNIFNGSLGKNLFKSTPNLRHLVITESLIRHIEGDAFENLVEKLLFVNLSENLLTTLSGTVFESVLISQRIFMIKLAKNDWICDCQLEEMAELYKLYHFQFIDGFYCKAPYHLHGIALDEVDFRRENCLGYETAITEDPDEFFSKTSTLKAHLDVDNENELTTSLELSSTVILDQLKVHCFDNDTRKSGHTDREYLQLPAPGFDFKLILIAENNTVVVSTDNSIQIFVIWFSEQLESSVATSYDNISFDYECMLRYGVPDFIVGPLQEDTTYTFCLIPFLQNAISPFNCMPLHVPAKNLDREDLWISEDYKPLTIGLLCLLFSLSAISGASIVYLCLRIYPSYLDGPQNVFAVKKPERICYVATISEEECQEQRKPPPLPEIPLTEISPTLGLMSITDLQRLSNLKTSSTCSNRPVAGNNFNNDGYQQPKECTNEYAIEQCSVLNKYLTTTGTPPPLPKRNSKNSKNALK